jgi:hypothetical protein
MSEIYNSKGKGKKTNNINKYINNNNKAIIREDFGLNGPTKNYFKYNVPDISETNKVNQNNYPYDPNKNRAYYEYLDNKMKKSIENNNINNINLLMSQSQSSIYKKPNDNNNINNHNYYVNNNMNNENSNSYNYDNNGSQYYIQNNNNINNNINNINIPNNLLSSTETTGPYRYMRKNRKDEPNLLDLLMEK